jgi:peptide-methionine (R)-S-oxide reductase
MADDKKFDVAMSDDDWKKKLTPEQFHVLRKHGTGGGGGGEPQKV